MLYIIFTTTPPPQISDFGTPIDFGKRGEEGSWFRLLTSRRKIIVESSAHNISTSIKQYSPILNLTHLQMWDMMSNLWDGILFIISEVSRNNRVFGLEPKEGTVSRRKQNSSSSFHFGRCCSSSSEFRARCSLSRSSEGPERAPRSQTLTTWPTPLRAPRRC